MMRKKTLKEVKEIVKRRGGKCLSKSYIDCKTKMKWGCNKGHTWHTTFDNICIGSWCPKCANNIKFNIHEVKKRVAEFGYRLISKKYINNRTPIKVMCNTKHIWRVRLNDLINKKQNCPICSKTKMRLKNAFSFNYINDEISKRNGKLLSKKYFNARTPLKLQCLVCKNIWKNRFDNIRNGQWCPKCNIKKSQNILTNILKTIFNNFNIKTNYRGFSWLKNKTGRNLEIDIFIYNKDNSFTLAVEYDGEQHFKPVRFGGMSEEKAKQKFIEQIERDKIKNKLINFNKKEIKYFIRFSYKDKLNIRAVKKKLFINNIIKESINGSKRV